VAANCIAKPDADSNADSDNSRFAHADGHDCAFCYADSHDSAFGHAYGDGVAHNWTLDAQLLINHQALDRAARRCRGPLFLGMPRLRM